MPERGNLTLAVIVKDEADLLDGLLHHHRHLYDEAVVVDTGSRDDSRLVALKAGARVFEYPWHDDFAAARNHGLQQSTGHWILQLDCDERIDPDDFAEILGMVRKPAEHCHTFIIHNYTETAEGGAWCETGTKDRPWCGGGAGYWKTQPIRLFPNRHQLRFSGVIHENIIDDLNKSTTPILQSNIVIHHTGLLSKSGRLRREKLYGPLLMKKVRSAPHDIRAITELARYLAGKNELVVAERLIAQGLKLVLNPDKEVQTNLLMVEIQTRLGKLNLAMLRLEKTIKNHPDQLLCWIQAVVLCLASGNQVKAKAYLRQGRQLFPLSPVLRQLESRLPEESFGKSFAN